MMGVYVKGMEMPSIGTYEASIDVTKSNGKTAISVYLRDENDSRRFSVGVYEAIHVPPHGRLIDADALHKLFEDQWHYLQVLDWNENPTAEAMQSGVNWCINTMHDDAPTVIEAEEDEECTKN